MSVIECNKKDFDEVVLKSKKKVLVDFNAVWCGPCRMMGPILEELSSEREDIVFVSVDVDNNESLAANYGIMSIPCLILFKDGKEVIRNVGFISKEELESMIGD